MLAFFHEYAIVGGMPEIVSQFAGNVTDRQIIRHIMAAAPSENDRVTFEGFGRSQYRSREVGEAMRSLDLARGPII